MWIDTGLGHVVDYPWGPSISRWGGDYWLLPGMETVAPTPVLLTVGQWMGLLLMPLLIFAVSFFLVRRKENRDELIALGRAHKAEVSTGR